MPPDDIDPATLQLFMPRPGLFHVRDYHWPQSNRILILGQTGSGKTWLAKRLLDQAYKLGEAQIVVYLSKPKVESFDRLAVARVDNVQALQRMLRKGERMVIMRPPPVDAMNPEVTEGVCQAIFEHNKSGSQPYPVILYIDEVSAFTRWNPRPSSWFAVLVTQGREMQKGMIMSAQEPAWLPRMVYAESQVIVRMYIHGRRNEVAIRDQLPQVLANTPLPAGDHSLVLWDTRARDLAFPFRKSI